MQAITRLNHVYVCHALWECSKARPERQFPDMWLGSWHTELMAALPRRWREYLTKAGLSQGRVLTSKSQNARFMPYPFSYPSSYPVIVHSRNARILLWSSWLHWEQDTVHTGVLVWDALEIRDFLSCLFFHCNDPPRDAQGACVLPVSSSVNSLPTSLSSSRNSKGNVPTL